MRLVFICITGRDQAIATELAATMVENQSFLLFGDYTGFRVLNIEDEGQEARQRGRISPIAAIKALWKCLPEIIRVTAHRIIRSTTSVQFLAWCYRYRKWSSALGSQLDQISPHAIVIFEDNVEGICPTIGGAAVKRGISYLIIPQTIPNPAEPAQFYLHSRTHCADGWLTRIFLGFAPDWGYVHLGRRLIRLPLSQALSQKFLGIASKKPWILNSGMANAICVESDELARIYRSLGFDEDQLKVIGHPVDDTLHRVFSDRLNRRRNLEFELGFVPDRPLIVIAFPPNQYSSPDVSDFESATFNDLCRTWKDALERVREKVNIVIRAHPRLKKEELLMFSDAGYLISDASTESLVPLADLYVACISATIRWALALGIPAINYDCYRYRYSDYVNAAGLRNVETGREFAELLIRFRDDAAYAEAWCASAEIDKKRWGIIDGRFVERFRQTLSKLPSVEHALRTTRSAGVA